MTKRNYGLGLLTSVAVAAVLAAGCGGGGDGNGPATATPAPSATRFPPPLTPSPTPSGRPPLVSGFVLLREDVRAGTGDAVAAAPENAAPPTDAGSFDRALSHADWVLRGPETRRGVTGADGGFSIPVLPPGEYQLEITRTLDGNLMAFDVPIHVGPSGDTRVLIEVAPGQTRVSSSWGDSSTDAVSVVVGPDGTRAVVRDGRLAELGASGQTLRDDDGDGRFDPTTCVDDQVWTCDDASACGADRVCGCTASCPFCEDCGTSVCVSPGAPTPYRCDPDGGCEFPGDRCVCVSSCPDCDDCSFSVCVPACEPVTIEALEVRGPSRMVAGQSGSVSAVARFSNGRIAEVTFLVTWESSDPEILRVDSWGTLTALAAGTTTVTAVLGDVASAPFSIEVEARPPLTRIQVENLSCLYPFGLPVDDGGPVLGLPEPAPSGDFLPPPGCRQVVRVGGSLQFSAFGEFGNGAYFEDITSEVSWQLTPSGIGEIVAGKFSAVGVGSVRLTATLDGVTSDPVEIRVVDQPTVVDLSIYPLDWGYPAIDGGPIAPESDVACWECGFGLTVLAGDTVRFAATAHYDTGEWEDVTADVTWRTNADGVAGIDASGVMTANAAGDARISAEFDGVSSNPVEVRVVADATLNSLSIYPEGNDRVLPRGGQMFFRATGSYDVGFSRDVTEEAVWRVDDSGIAAFESPGVLTGRAAGVVKVWAELDGLRSEYFQIEVFATGEIDYCDPDRVNRGLWSDDFNRVVLESDCGEYRQPGVATLRYTVTETQPHGGIFDPCLDLYVFDGDRRVRTLREEGCGEPFLAVGAPEFDDAVTKFQLLAFWDLKDDDGRPVPPGTYTVYGRFFLYYDPVVRIDVTVLPADGTTPPTPTPTPATETPATATPTPTPFAFCTPVSCARDEVAVCPGGDCSQGCPSVCVPAPVCTPPACRPGEVLVCSGTCFGGCGSVCVSATPTPTPRGRSASVHLAAGTAEGAPGETVEIRVSMDTVGDVAVAGVQNDLLFDPALLALAAEGCRINPEIGDRLAACDDDPPAGPCKQLLTNVVSCSDPRGCDAAAEPLRRLRALVLSSSNVNPIPPGLLYTCMFRIVGDTATSAVVTMTRESASDPGGNALTTETRDGRVAIIGGVDRATPTPTPDKRPLPELSGPWTITLPILGLQCAGKMAQGPSGRIDLDVDCAGVAALVSGEVTPAGRLSLRGTAPPLCEELRLDGSLAADGAAINGLAVCDGRSVPFDARRGSAPSTPTPTPRSTPPDRVTPNPTDLSGRWDVSVAVVDLVCPADVTQDGERLEISLDCADTIVRLQGTADGSGTVTVHGSYPPLCPTLDLEGRVSDDGRRLTGTAVCPGLNLPFEAVRVGREFR